MPRSLPIPALTLVATTVLAQDNPFEEEARKSYAGRFKSAKGEVVLRDVGDGAYEGQASFLGKTLPLAGSLRSGELRGQLGSGKDRFPFTCTFDSAGKLRFKAGSFSSVLERVPAKDLSGHWGDKRVRLGLKRSQKGDYAGTVTLKGKSFRLVGRQDATGLLKGVFESGGKRFPFSVREYNGGVEFKTGSFKAALRPIHSLTKQAVEQAKKLKGFTYLDRKTFSCGKNLFEVARFRHDQTGLVFHLLPGGVYDRGSRRLKSEQPVAEVRIKPFLICATECTQAAWGKVMGNNPSHYKGPNRPVEMVSWNEARSFCSKSGLRLPSETEWEYACRAGSTTAYFFGSSAGDLGRYAEYADNNDKETKNVAHKLPNAFGLYDVYGNVWELCEDVYARDYMGAPTKGGPRVAASPYRVIRGGGIHASVHECRSAFRTRYWPGKQSRALGFRPARSLP